MDGRGFTPETWRGAAVFAGRCATPHDVDSRAAVYALGDTWNGRPIDMELPQPVIWWAEDDDEHGALAVQAEAHETEDGETMEVLGLLLPDGGVAVALLDDVDVVDDTDPVWRELVEPLNEEDDGDCAGYLLDDEDDDDVS